jgi:Na+-translocating ferredoxin:NAD+ oxidoreductase RnfD subunit
MTSYDWEVVAVSVCISGVAGVILGVLVHHRIKLAISCIVVVALMFFCTLQWRFGQPHAWPWQDTASGNAFMFGAFFRHNTAHIWSDCA